MRHSHYHHGPSPFFIIAMGMLLFWVFGFKLFFFLPLLFIFGAMGRWGYCGMSEHYDWEGEKPKRKRKNDEYVVIDDENDITYL